MIHRKRTTATGTRTRGRLGVAVAVAAAITLPFTSAAPASAQVPVGEADFSGFATGTVIHADALQSGTTRVVNAEVAYAGATVDSKGLDTPLVNELGRTVQAPQAGKNTFGRGAALEIGLGADAGEDGQIILSGKAEAAAPPSTDLITEEIADPGLDPLAYASIVRGQAQARWVPGDCILGSDMSFGLGYAADAELIDAGGDDSASLDSPIVSTNHPDPARGVSQSLTRTRLVAQTKADGALVGSNLGLMSEVRQTIAPVTLFAGMAQQTTIEFLGEWVLQAVATGIPGAGYVHYGPGQTSPSTPILRIIDAAGAVTDVLSFQDLLGDEGLSVEIPGVAEITIGEDPRAIGGAADSAPAVAADGTSVSAAVDVVRIRLLDQGDVRAAQIRVGHMEVSSTVPAGGISCPGVKVAKTADRGVVNPGEKFTYTVTVTNPYDCILTAVKVVDTITAPPQIKYTIDGSNPAADATTADSLTWNDIGPLNPGESKSLTIDISIANDSRAGTFINTAVVTADCAVGSAQDRTSIKVPLRGEVRVVLPDVPAAVIPITGMSRSGLVVASLAGLAALGLVRLRRRTA